MHRLLNCGYRRSSFASRSLLCDRRAGGRVEFDGAYPRDAQANPGSLRYVRRFARSPTSFGRDDSGGYRYFSGGSVKELLADTAARAAKYLGELDHRSVVPSQEAIARLKDLGGPLPEHPCDPAEVLALLDDIGSPATVATAGPRYFG